MFAFTARGSPFLLLRGESQDMLEKTLINHGQEADSYVHFSAHYSFNIVSKYSLTPNVYFNA